MIASISGRHLTLSAFAAALLIGTAPAAYAQCAGATGETAGASSGEEQAAAATGQSGETVGESMTTTPGTEADSEIATDQGGTTVDESGAATPQGDAATDQAGQGAATAQTGAKTEAQTVSGADEERIRSMLEQQGYTEVSSIASCGTYYEAQAMQDGEQVTLQIDLESGRVSPPQ